MFRRLMVWLGSLLLLSIPLSAAAHTEPLGFPEDLSKINTIEVAIPVSGMVYSEALDLVFLSIPANETTYPNEVWAVDPDTLDVVGFATVPVDPAQLAVSDDGSALYVALGGSPEIAKIDTATMTEVDRLRSEEHTSELQSH